MRKENWPLWWCLDSEIRSQGAKDELVNPNGKEVKDFT